MFIDLSAGYDFNKGFQLIKRIMQNMSLTFLGYNCLFAIDFRCHEEKRWVISRNRDTVVTQMLIISIKTNKFERVKSLFCVWDDITSVKVFKASKSQRLYFFKVCKTNKSYCFACLKTKTRSF